MEKERRGASLGARGLCGTDKVMEKKRDLECEKEREKCDEDLVWKEEKEKEKKYQSRCGAVPI